MKNKKILPYLGGLLGLLLLFILFRGDPLIEKELSSNRGEVQADTATEREAMEEVEREYGMVTDSFQVVRGTVRPNQFLAEILQDYGVSYQEVDRLVRESDSIFDVRRIRAGKEYTVFCDKDSAGRARCFVYQPDPVHYVLFDLRDSIEVRRGEKAVETKERTASGTIESSLFESLSKRSISPLVALELSEIYAWTIDFYRVDKGDRFRVLYEEHYVDGRSIGIGEIKGAEFIHRDSSYYAFRFEEDSSAEYFDENGKSLRKAFLKAPLRFSRISSGFSSRRYHPVLGQYRSHYGVDYAAPTGTPVRSVGDGRVVESGYTSGNGHYVKIRHNSVYTTMYLHFSSREVHRGERVSQGDVIGKVGSTGLATGPHTCYRVYKNGSPVNPLTLDIPPGEPVGEEHEEAFQERKEELLERLRSIPFEDSSKGPQV